MRRPDPNVFPILLCAAILTAGAAGVAAGAHLQKVVTPPKPASKASFSFFANALAQTTYRFVDDEPKLAPVPRPDVSAPKF
jgi:glutamine synthetase